MFQGAHIPSAAVFEVSAALGNLYQVSVVLSAEHNFIVHSHEGHVSLFSLGFVSKPPKLKATQFDLPSSEKRKKNLEPES
jgi:hypothetical protein